MNRAGRICAWFALSAAGAILIWQLVAEIVEPYYLLSLQPGSRPLEVETIGGTVLRLYRDTYPHVGKIAGLQKGLVWAKDGRALVEEGYGFGCPIIESDGQAFLSRHAETERVALGDVTRLVKHYQIDTVDTPIRLLRRKYRPVPPLGTVTFRYDVRPEGVIDVEVDFSRMERPWSKAYLMNEQGARRFTRYRDSHGTDLAAGELGIWDRQEVPVRRACFDSDDGALSFCVEPGETPTVYYGRERYCQYNWRGIFYLSWAGIDVELTGPRPAYRYRIVLEAR